jgi:hypothetical protein
LSSRRLGGGAPTSAPEAPTPDAALRQVNNKRQ